MLTKYYRKKIIEVWGDPRKVAGAAYSAFLPYDIRAHWIDEEDGHEFGLDDCYPCHERALDIGVMAVELKDQQDVFLTKLDEKLKETFKDAIISDDDGIGEFEPQGPGIRFRPL